MNEVSLKPVIAELEDLFSKFNARFFADKLEKPVITVSPDHTRGAYYLFAFAEPDAGTGLVYQQQFGHP